MLNNPYGIAFAAMALDHAHIYGMAEGLVKAGARLKWVFDHSRSRAEDFVRAFPETAIAASEEEILRDPEVLLVAAAAVPSERWGLGLRVLEAGKDYFTDKSPFTTLEQLEQARRKTVETGRKYMVYYGERLNSEAALYAEALIREGAIGRVVQVAGFGPHRLQAEKRPDWFFEKEKYGGILTDIGCHQIEQFLHYTGAKDARILYARAGNTGNPEYPGLEDFGDAALAGDNGAAHYFRVDWLTPSGLGTWGDGRTWILGTEGYIEIRRNIDIARDREGEHVYLVNREGEQHIKAKGQVPVTFYRELIEDCLNRTEKAMTQEHAFKAAELALKLQEAAMPMAPAKENG